MGEESGDLGVHFGGGEDLGAVDGVGGGGEGGVKEGRYGCGCA